MNEKLIEACEVLIERLKYAHTERAQKYLSRTLQADDLAIEYAERAIKETKTK